MTHRLIAAVHLSPSITVPVAVVAGIALGWLWWWQGREGVPTSRRRLRRISIVGMLMLVPMLVAGTSLIDPDVEPRRYAEVWTLLIGILLIVVALAVADALNTLRLHAREASDASDAIARELAEVAARRLGSDPLELDRRSAAIGAEKAPSRPGRARERAPGEGPGRERDA